MTTHVTETAAAPSELAVKHFEEMLAFETDCWDVHESMKSADRDFIVIDVRGPNAFAKGHVEGAINIPHREMTAVRMARQNWARLWRMRGCAERTPSFLGQLGGGRSLFHPKRRDRCRCRR